jgi:hypothetical protein
MNGGALPIIGMADRRTCLVEPVCITASVRKFSTVPVLYPKGAELELELVLQFLKTLRTGTGTASTSIL